MTYLIDRDETIAPDRANMKSLRESLIKNPNMKSLSEYIYKYLPTYPLSNQYIFNEEYHLYDPLGLVAPDITRGKFKIYLPNGTEEFPIKLNNTNYRGDCKFNWIFEEE